MNDEYKMSERERVLLEKILDAVEALLLDDKYDKARAKKDLPELTARFNELREHNLYEQRN